MDYINEVTGEWPVSYEQILAAFPNTSFAPPEDFNPPAPFKPVAPTAHPEFNAATQLVREAYPKLIDGEWTQQWVVIEIFATQEERDASIALAEATALKVKREAMIVTPWQIRKALNDSSLRTLVEAAVASADQETMDAWAFAQEFKRLDPLVAAIATAIGKTDEDLDALFELAVTL